MEALILTIRELPRRWRREEFPKETVRIGIKKIDYLFEVILGHPNSDDLIILGRPKKIGGAKDEQRKVLDILLYLGWTVTHEDEHLFDRSHATIKVYRLDR